MKTDDEVRLLFRERKKGRTQEQAAARAGMSVRTARKYEISGELPSSLQQPRAYRTRQDPFEADWPWVRTELERDAALQAKTLFGLLCLDHPGRYQEGQIRTLQRRIEQWRALHGPERDVIFEQVHEPGRMAQSDFTDMDELGITIGGSVFRHLLYHVVLTYSNHEAIKVCFSESFESLAEGIEAGLWQIGGVPAYHRTDNLSAAVRRLDAEGLKDFTERYQALMRHYDMIPTRNTPGESHQNGDIEQAHNRLKDAIDQTLRVRGSRDFETRDAYEAFLQEIVRLRNLTRSERFTRDQQALRPLPANQLDPCQRLFVTVSRFSTIRVLRNTYSVPSRLIGSELTVRVRAEQLELFLGSSFIMTLPRLKGLHKCRIDYRHVIWSLVRKPGAFAAYRFRDEFFPTTTFRRAYDAITATKPVKGDLEYLRILHFAAGTSEIDVEAGLDLLLEMGEPFDFLTVRDLVNASAGTAIPDVTPPASNLAIYDRLLAPRCGHG
jgi:transcriptional regulator with XRE-family HTH domain